jgi:hypothetical protein
VFFILAVALAALVAHRQERWTHAASVSARALGSRWAPLAAGLLWALVIAHTWGTLHPVPVFHDELSYVFQAQLFAEGRWFAPSPPMADIWAQPHLLVVPVMASKYPPGHALLLSLGALAGNPGLVVLALAMLRGALIFVLARRLGNGAIALVTTVLLLHGDALHWGASFFSETTTCALVLVGWYALLRWHDEGHTRWIALLALALGWCAITRPVTALAVALPIGVVVTRDVWRTNRWRDFGLAVAIGTAIVAILPLWSARTTGDPGLWPATLYTRDYMPYDYPHFGVVDARPRRELPPDLAAISPSLLAEEQAHTLMRAPRIAVERMTPLARSVWQNPLAELALAIVGVASIPAAAMVGVATVGTLFFGYLAHPTWADWTIYYMEIAPVLVFLAVCGLARLFQRISASERELGGLPSVSSATLPLLVTSALLLLVVVLPESTEWRETYRKTSGYRQEFLAAANRLPAPAVLFVGYGPRHSPHLTLIANGPDWPRAPVWIVANRGDARNAAFLRLVPGRRGFLFDEARARIDSYRPDASP